MLQLGDIWALKVPFGPNGPENECSWKKGQDGKKNGSVKLYGPFFVDGVQLPQGYSATTGRQFTFYQHVPRNSWYSFDRPWKDERLSRPWSYQVGLNMGPLNWKSSALTSYTFFENFWVFFL